MRILMRRVLTVLGIAIAGYFVAWVLAYSIVMEFDYAYLGRYFILAWSGGGELPAFIQLIALSFALITAIAAMLVVLGRNKMGGKPD